jgi:superoxide dismutase, Fe-Mn family
MNNQKYVQKTLPYHFDALAPVISEKQLRLHYEKHHAAYVSGANAILDKLSSAREDGSELDMKAILKALSFNIAGHLLHSLFWDNLVPAGKSGEPEGALKDAIEGEFSSSERFKKEFTQAALTVEGSGWAALAVCPETGRPIIMQIEKHNFNVIPFLKILLVLDVFEHAYYLDYMNDRAKFIEEFWKIVDWKAVEARLVK